MKSIFEVTSTLLCVLIMVDRDERGNHQRRGASLRGGAVSLAPEHARVRGVSHAATPITTRRQSITCLQTFIILYTLEGKRHINVSFTFLT